MFFKLRHKILHIFGYNTGNVVSWQEDGFIFVAFKCDGCGEIDPRSISKIESEMIYGKRHSDSGTE